MACQEAGDNSDALSVISGTTSGSTPEWFPNSCFIIRLPSYKSLPSVQKNLEELSPQIPSQDINLLCSPEQWPLTRQSQNASCNGRHKVSQEQDLGKSQDLDDKVMEITSGSPFPFAGNTGRPGATMGQTFGGEIQGNFSAVNGTLKHLQMCTGIGRPKFDCVRDNETVHLQTSDAAMQMMFGSSDVVSASSQPSCVEDSQKDLFESQMTTECTLEAQIPGLAAAQQNVTQGIPDSSSRTLQRFPDTDRVTNSIAIDSHKNELPGNEIYDMPLEFTGNQTIISHKQMSEELLKENRSNETPKTVPDEVCENDDGEANSISSNSTIPPSNVKPDSVLGCCKSLSVNTAETSSCVMQKGSQTLAASISMKESLQKEETLCITSTQSIVSCSGFSLHKVESTDYAKLTSVHDTTRKQEEKLSVEVDEDSVSVNLSSNYIIPSSVPLTLSSCRMNPLPFGSTEVESGCQRGRQNVAEKQSGLENHEDPLDMMSSSQESQKSSCLILCETQSNQNKIDAVTRAKAPRESAYCAVETEIVNDFEMSCHYHGDIQGAVNSGQSNQKRKLAGMGIPLPAYTLGFCLTESPAANSKTLTADQNLKVHGDTALFQEQEKLHTIEPSNIKMDKCTHGPTTGRSHLSQLTTNDDQNLETQTGINLNHNILRLGDIQCGPSDVSKNSCDAICSQETGKQLQITGCNTNTDFDDGPLPKYSGVSQTYETEGLDETLAQCSMNFDQKNIDLFRSSHSSKQPDISSSHFSSTKNGIITRQKHKLQVHAQEMQSFQRLVDLYDNILGKLDRGIVLDGKSQLQRFEHILQKLSKSQEKEKKSLFLSKGKGRRSEIKRLRMEQLLEKNVVLLTATKKHSELEKRVLATITNTDSEETSKCQVPVKFVYGQHGETLGSECLIPCYTQTRSSQHSQHLTACTTSPNSTIPPLPVRDFDDEVSVLRKKTGTKSLLDGSNVVPFKISLKPEFQLRSSTPGADAKSQGSQSLKQINQVRHRLKEDDSNTEKRLWDGVRANQANLVSIFQVKQSPKLVNQGSLPGLGITSLALEPTRNVPTDIETKTKHTVNRKPYGVADTFAIKPTNDGTLSAQGINPTASLPCDSNGKLDLNSLKTATPTLQTATSTADDKRLTGKIASSTRDYSVILIDSESDENVDDELQSSRNITQAAFVDTKGLMAWLPSNSGVQDSQAKIPVFKDQTGNTKSDVLAAKYSTEKGYHNECHCVKPVEPNLDLAAGLGVKRAHSVDTVTNSDNKIKVLPYQIVPVKEPDLVKLTGLSNTKPTAASSKKCSVQSFTTATVDVQGALTSRASSSEHQFHSLGDDATTKNESINSQYHSYVSTENLKNMSKTELVQKSVQTQVSILDSVCSTHEITVNGECQFAETATTQTVPDSLKKNITINTSLASVPIMEGSENLEVCAVTGAVNSVETQTPIYTEVSQERHRENAKFVESKYLTPEKTVMNDLPVKEQFVKMNYAISACRPSASESGNTYTQGLPTSPCSTVSSSLFAVSSKEILRRMEMRMASQKQNQPSFTAQMHPFSHSDVSSKHRVNQACKLNPLLVLDTDGQSILQKSDALNLNRPTPQSVMKSTSFVPTSIDNHLKSGLGQGQVKNAVASFGSLAEHNSSRNASEMQYSIPATSSDSQRVTVVGKTPACATNATSTVFRMPACLSQSNVAFKHQPAGKLGRKNSVEKGTKKRGRPRKRNAECLDKQTCKKTKIPTSGLIENYFPRIQQPTNQQLNSVYLDKSQRVLPQSTPIGDQKCVEDVPRNPDYILPGGEIDIVKLIDSLHSVELIADQELKGSASDFSEEFWEENFEDITMSQLFWSTVDVW